MSKMGISTYQSYCGAQIFDAVGLRTSFVDKYFTGTHSQVEGVGLAQIARETVERHRQAFGNVPTLANALDVGGEYAYRVRGEAHMWRPAVVADLQHAVRGADNKDAKAGKIPQKFRDYARQIDEQSEQLMTLRGLFRIKSADEMDRKPVPLDEVEPAAEIVKRFCDGRDELRLDQPRGAHHAGDRHEPHRRQVEHRRGRRGGGPLQAAAERRFSMRSAIKQVASGRFGVTTEYLVNSDMMQIKMAQGAKPGEGGQLPGHKVDAVIAKRAAFDAGRRPDLAAAAPRHLLDRGSGAADLRPEERQPDGRRVGEARLRGRRRHGRRRRRQGARRPRHDRRLRGRHRRLAADLDQARRLARGRSALPRRTRRWSPTGCAAASRCRSTAACAPAATS